MTASTLEIQGYYANLLIIQYVGQPRASATIRALAGMAIMPQTSVQTVSFDLPPTEGSLVLAFDGNPTTSIEWDDDAATVQTKLRAVDGLGSVTVAGTAATQLLSITMEGLTPPADMLTLVSNTLLSGATGTNRLLTEGGDFLTTEDGDRLDTSSINTPVIVTIAEIDQTLPLAVMNGYDMTSDTPAVGKQLDVLGKYAGVERSAFGFNTQITLDDEDYLQFIKIAILRNNSDSSLATIQDLIATFFPGEILVFDYQNMRMSYMISFGIGSQDLVQLFVTEGLLPKPMGVQLASVIYLPSVTKVFGFRTYTTPAYNVTPFNSYSNHNSSWIWISYANRIA